MRRNLWLSIWIASINVSCGTMGVPATPEGKLCTIDVPRDQLICYPYGGLVMRKNTTMRSVERYIAETREPSFISINDADKYIAFDPNSWAGLSEYIDEMKTIIRGKCKL